MFRAKGDHIEEVDLLTREGLTVQLGILGTELHPGRALADFIARQKRDGSDESVIVTEADAADDPDFRRCLRTQDLEKIYLATVARSGRFQLLEYPALDGKPLSDATLDLDKILPSESMATTPVLDPNYDTDLPMILAVHPFPFLFPVRGRVQHVVNNASGDGACAMRDGRLLVWSGRKHGACQLTAELPRGKTVLIERTENEFILVKLLNRSVRITTIGVGGEVATVERALTSDLLGARYESGAVLLILADGVEALDPLTGAIVSELDTGDKLWARGRYFAGNGWHALTWDGLALALVPVPIAPIEGFRPEDVIQVFDSPAHEGPLVLVRGHGVRSSTGELLLGGDVAFVEGISADGSRVLANAADGSYLCFDLEKRKSRKLAVSPGRWLDARGAYVPTRS